MSLEQTKIRKKWYVKEFLYVNQRSLDLELYFLSYFLAFNKENMI